jgi:hypothetical protein
MTGLAERTRDLALRTERVVVDRQHAGLAADAPADAGPAVIGALDLAAAVLWAATRAPGLPRP